MAAPAEYEDVPLTSMRRTIGKRLLESTQQLPHFYATAEINMGEFLRVGYLEEISCWRDWAYYISKRYVVLASRYGDHERYLVLEYETYAGQ